MVLPEELVNYVKDQLLIDAPVGNIIADVKAKGYQISSSTIYKIRATLNPKRENAGPQIPLPIAQIIEERPQPTPAWNFGPIDITPCTGALLASVDIQDTQIIVVMQKNEQQIMTRAFKYHQQDPNNAQEILKSVEKLCDEMQVTQAMLTSFFLKEQSVLLPNMQKELQIQKYQYCCKYSVAIASRYVKLLNKDIVVIVFDDMLESFYMDKNYKQSQLQLEHSIIMGDRRDSRVLKQTCKQHNYCAQHYLTMQSFQLERDYDFYVLYTSQMIHNAAQARPSCCFILTGRLFNVCKAQKFVQDVKVQLQILAPECLPDTLVHCAAHDAAAIGAVQVLEKQLNEDQKTMATFASPVRQRIYSRPTTAVDFGNVTSTTPYEMELLSQMAKKVDDE